MPKRDGSHPTKKPQQRRVDPTEEHAERLSARQQGEIPSVPHDNEEKQAQGRVRRMREPIHPSHSSHTLEDPKEDSGRQPSHGRVCDSDMEELSEIFMPGGGEVETRGPAKQTSRSTHGRMNVDTEKHPLSEDKDHVTESGEGNIHTTTTSPSRRRPTARPSSTSTSLSCIPEGHTDRTTKKTKREEDRKIATKTTTTTTTRTRRSNEQPMGVAQSRTTHHRRGGERIDITQTPVLHHHNPEHDANRELQYRLQFLNGGRGPNRRSHGDGALLIYGGACGGGGGIGAGEGGKKALSKPDLDLLRSSGGSRRTSSTRLQDSMTVHTISASLSDSEMVVHGHVAPLAYSDPSASPCQPTEQDTTLAPNPQSDSTDTETVATSSRSHSHSPNPVSPDAKEDAEQQVTTSEREAHTRRRKHRKHETPAETRSGRGDPSASEEKRKSSRETRHSPQLSGRATGSKGSKVPNSQRAGSYLSTSSCGLSPELWRSQSSPGLDGLEGEGDAVRLAASQRVGGSCADSSRPRQARTERREPMPVGGGGTTAPVEGNDVIENTVASQGCHITVHRGGEERRGGGAGTREIEVELQFSYNQQLSPEKGKRDAARSASPHSKVAIAEAERNKKTKQAGERSQSERPHLPLPAGLNSDLLRRAMAAAFAAGEDPHGEQSQQWLDLLHAAAAADAVGRREHASGDPASGSGGSSRLGMAPASSSSMSSAAAAVVAIQRFGHQWLWEHQSALSSSSSSSSRSSARVTPPGSSNAVKVSKDQPPVRVAMPVRTPPESVRQTRGRGRTHGAQEKEEKEVDGEETTDDGSAPASDNQPAGSAVVTEEEEETLNKDKESAPERELPEESAATSSASRFITREELTDVILKVLKMMRQHQEEVAGRRGDRGPETKEMSSSPEEELSSRKTTDAATSPTPSPRTEEDRSAGEGGGEGESAAPLESNSKKLIVRKGMPPHVQDHDEDTASDTGEGEQDRHEPPERTWEVPQPPIHSFLSPEMVNDEVGVEKRISISALSPSSLDSASQPPATVKQYRTSLDRHEPLRRRRRTTRPPYPTSVVMTSSSPHSHSLSSSTPSLSTSLSSHESSTPPLSIEMELDPSTRMMIEEPTQQKQIHDSTEYRDRSPSVSPSEEPSPTEEPRSHVPASELPEAVDWSDGTAAAAAAAASPEGPGSSSSTSTSTHPHKSSHSAGVVIRLPPGVEEAEAARVAALPPHLRRRHSPSPVIQRHHLQSSISAAAGSSGSSLSGSGSPFFSRRSPGESSWLHSRSSVSPSPLTSAESILIHRPPSGSQDSASATPPRPVSQLNVGTQTVQDKETQYEPDTEEAEGSQMKEEEEEEDAAETTAHAQNAVRKTCEASTTTDPLDVPDAVPDEQSGKQQEERGKGVAPTPDQLLSSLERRQPMGLAALRRKWEEEKKEEAKRSGAMASDASKDEERESPEKTTTVTEDQEESQQGGRRTGSAQSVPISEEAARERGLLSLIFSEENSCLIPGGKLLVPTRRDKHHMTTVSVNSQSISTLSDGNPLGTEDGEAEEEEERLEQPVKPPHPTLSIKNLLAHATAHDEHGKVDGSDDEESTIIVSSEAFCEGEEAEEEESARQAGRGSKVPSATPSSIVLTTFQEAPREDVTHTPTNVSMYSFTGEGGVHPLQGSANNDVQELRDMIAHLHREVTTLLRHSKHDRFSTATATTTTMTTAAVIENRKEMKRQLQQVLQQVERLQLEREGQHSAQMKYDRSDTSHWSEEFARMEELLRSTIATLELSVSDSMEDMDNSANSGEDDRTSLRHHILSSSEREEDSHIPTEDPPTMCAPAAGGGGRPFQEVPSLDLRPLSLCPSVTPLDPSLLSSTEEDVALSPGTGYEGDENVTEDNDTARCERDETEIMLATPPTELLTARAGEESDGPMDHEPHVAHGNLSALDMLQADVDRIKAENEWLYQQILLQQAQQAQAALGYPTLNGTDGMTEVNISMTTSSDSRSRETEEEEESQEALSLASSSAEDGDDNRKNRHRYSTAPSPMEDETTMEERCTSMTQKEEAEADDSGSSTASSCVLLMSAPQDVLLNEEEDIDEDDENDENDEGSNRLRRSSTREPAPSATTTTTTTTAPITASSETDSTGCTPSPSLPLLQASSGHLLSFPHHPASVKDAGPHAAQCSIRPGHHAGETASEGVLRDSGNVVLSSLVSADQYPARPSFFGVPLPPVPDSAAEIPAAVPVWAHTNAIAEEDKIHSQGESGRERVTTPHGAPYSATWMAEFMAAASSAVGSESVPGSMIDVLSLQHEHQKRLNAMVQQTREDRLRIQMEHEADQARLQHMQQEDTSALSATPPLSANDHREHRFDVHVHDHDHHHHLTPQGQDQQRGSSSASTSRASSSSTSGESMSSEIFISQPNYIRHTTPPLTLQQQRANDEPWCSHPHNESVSRQSHSTTATEDTESTSTSTSASLEGKEEEEVVDILITRHRHHHQRGTREQGKRTETTHEAVRSSSSTSTISSSSEDEDDERKQEKIDLIARDKRIEGPQPECIPTSTDTAGATTSHTEISAALEGDTILDGVSGLVKMKEQVDHEEFTALQQQLLQLQHELQETIRSRQEMERRSLEDQEELQEAHQAHVQRIHTMLNTLQREQMEYEQEVALRALRGDASPPQTVPVSAENGAVASSLSVNGELKSGGRQRDTEELDRQIQHLARELQQLHVAIQSTVKAREEIQVAAATQSQEVRNRNAAEQATMDALLIHLGDRLRRAQIQQEQFQQEAVHLVEYASADHRAEMKRLHMEMEELQEVIAVATTTTTTTKADAAALVRPPSSSSLRPASSRRGKRTGSKSRHGAEERGHSSARVSVSESGSEESSERSPSTRARSSRHQDDDDEKAYRHQKKPMSSRRTESRRQSKKKDDEEEEAPEAGKTPKSSRQRQGRRPHGTSAASSHSRPRPAGSESETESEREAYEEPEQRELVDIAPRYPALQMEERKKHSHAQGGPHDRSASNGARRPPSPPSPSSSSRAIDTKERRSGRLSPSGKTALPADTTSSSPPAARAVRATSGEESQLGPWGEERSYSDEQNHSWMQQEPQPVAPHRHKRSSSSSSSSLPSNGTKARHRASHHRQSATSDNELSGTTHLTSISLTGSLPSSGLSTARPTNGDDDNHDDNDERHTQQMTRPSSDTAALSAAGPPPLHPSSSYPTGRAPPSQSHAQRQRPPQHSAPHGARAALPTTSGSTSSSLSSAKSSCSSRRSTFSQPNPSRQPSQPQPQRRISSPAPRPPLAPGLPNGASSPALERSLSGVHRMAPHHKSAHRTSSRNDIRASRVSSSGQEVETSTHTRTPTHRRNSTGSSTSAVEPHATGSPYSQPVRSSKKKQRGREEAVGVSRDSGAPSVYTVDVSNALPLPPAAATHHATGPSFSRFPRENTTTRQEQETPPPPRSPSASVPTSSSSSSPSPTHAPSTHPFSRPTTIAAAVAAAKQRSRSKSASGSGSRRAASSSSRTSRRESPTASEQRRSKWSPTVYRGRRYLRGARSPASSVVPPSLWTNVEDNAPWDIHTLKLPPNTSLSAYAESKRGNARAGGSRSSRQNTSRSPDTHHQDQKKLKRLKEELLNLSDMEDVDDDSRYDYLLHRHGFFGEVYKFGVATSPSRRR